MGEARKSCLPDFGMVPFEMVRDKKVGANGLRLYVVLSVLTRGGDVPVGRKELSGYTDIPETRISEELSNLVTQGWVGRKRGGRGNPSAYTCLIPQIEAETGQAQGSGPFSIDVTESVTSRKLDVTKSVTSRKLDITKSVTSKPIDVTESVTSKPEKALDVTKSVTSKPTIDIKSITLIDISNKERENTNINVDAEKTVHYRLAKLLYSEHQKADARFLAGKPLAATFARWGEDIEKLIRLDERNEHEVARVIRWCQADSFWNSNILSGKKLREKYPQLIARMKSAQGKRVEITEEDRSMLNDLAFG